MTRDELKQMAKEAGIVSIHAEHWGDGLLVLEKFAELASAKAVAAEREACAKVCEAYIAEGIGKEMADAIRARGDK